MLDVVLHFSANLRTEAANHPSSMPPHLPERSMEEYKRRFEASSMPRSSFVTARPVDHRGLQRDDNDREGEG